MADFLIMHVSHAYIMEDPAVVDEVIYFLKHGRFSHIEALPAPDGKK
jgi:hypothetical protein